MRNCLREKLGDFKNTGKKLEYFLSKIVFLRKIITMFFKNYEFLSEKLLKRRFFKKFENFKRKNQNFNKFERKMFEFIHVTFVCVLCFGTQFRIQEFMWEIFLFLKILKFFKKVKNIWEKIFESFHKTFTNKLLCRIST